MTGISDTQHIGIICLSDVMFRMVDCCEGLIGKSGTKMCVQRNCSMTDHQAS